jgi:hypothetical protein
MLFEYIAFTLTLALTLTPIQELKGEANTYCLPSRAVAAAIQLQPSMHTGHAK